MSARRPKTVKTAAPVPLSRREAARARRKAREARRADWLDKLADGFTIEELAQGSAVSVRTVNREIARALDARRGATPRRYAELQVLRLERALVMVSRSVNNGDVDAVPHLTHLLREMDRYQSVRAAYEPAESVPAATAPRRLSPRVLEDNRMKSMECVSVGEAADEGERLGEG